jgi:hypothetical protein
VEPHANERADAGVELGRQVVGEGSIEREERPVDADRDGAGEDVREAIDRGRVPLGLG